MIEEKLNEVTTARGLIIAAVTIFDEAIDHLINKVFRKTDFVVESVIESLFEHSGPLFDFKIRLKVLLGLGVISKEIFEDINAFIKLKEIINNQEQEASFSDPMFLKFIQQLHCIKESLFIKDPIPDPKATDSLLEQVKIIRWEKMIRSYLILSILHINEALQIESPL
ncbi:mannitol repressor protein [Gallibacterium salpingitidis]|uniref:Mannitol repressor protein n=1 Tax=Gallibacterium salpingitidis TaxID=505341 RepID=A0A1A7Q9Q3_9PAST|nr:MltR family transcriptional regulator [Gallibacterium salpingitidis]OBW93350.1 mannitol repressor protein [Gallibacterium salpingitidis]OBX07450.1 mannitol repressor protein [Gallibacterium salpingitidis]OBX10841.1 mannitol repressor protein [Gallibacterium salpingitidis]